MGAAEKSMMTRVKEQEMGRLLPSALRTPLRPFVTLLTRRSLCLGEISGWLGSTSRTVHS